MATPLKKRKSKDFALAQRKLLQGQKIELRSTEEGFEGSWHPATVIKCEDSTRLVRYNHILLDDHSDYLTETVLVPPIIDGIVPQTPTPPTHRNFIRPTPPPILTHQRGLGYGLCVDSFVNDAWWEGVIFDHHDGSDERVVFFPDRGEQELTRVEHLRISQDWDEGSDCWRRRGVWLFLELVEEHGRERPLDVSARQLWCDLRMMEVYWTRIKEWTCCVRSMWDDLVLEVIRSNLVSQKQVEMSSPGEEISSESVIDSSDSEPRGSKVAPNALEGQLENKSILRFKLKKKDNSGDWDLVGSPGLSHDFLVESDDEPTSPSISERKKCYNLRGNQEGRKVRDFRISYREDDSRSSKSHRQAKRSKSGAKKWLLAGEDIVPGPGYCPDVLLDYFIATGRERFKVATRVRMHLLSVGWKIYYKRHRVKSGNDLLKFRYINPEGNSFLSIPPAVKHLRKTTVKVQNMEAGHEW